MFQVTKDDGLKKVEDLVEAFDRNLRAYKSLAYKEAQVRAEYIDPFFEALGWDIYNKSHFAEAYKDVIHEDAIKTGGAHKAPDYSFRVGGRRVFFVEAKKPAANIKEDPRLVYQLRRYGWSAGLNLSILTDFEELALYDCRIRPMESDKTGTGRVKYLGFREYLEKFDDIHGLFGKEAVLQGSIERYANETKKMRGTAPVDKEFLKEIESWRDQLARTIALRNPDLSVYELNFSVQRIIDRIIFLRICEDRGIEDYGHLQAFGTGENIYQRLLERFDRAEERYNSGLFHFQRERNQTTEPDNLTPKLQIDDKVLQDIFKNLYYPASPYEFSVVGADILGKVYEQFLGKVIRLTAGHRAKVEEKPEVRKAGGVYYTPTYIVDYIVKNTVGRLCEGEPEESNRDNDKAVPESSNGERKRFKLTPRQVRKLHILDPACGSGSFLIGAYQYLLDYCRDWYVANDPDKHKKAVYQGKGRLWFLTQAEKKAILLDCIYGVDIDSQAVEVTKLNLLLKALEGESSETIEKQIRLFRERALPDLGSNIKCGNSLIGTDFFEYYQDALFDDEEIRRVNPFDWESEFPQIMKAGGFDAVIGNPPYLIVTSDVFPESSIQFLKRSYLTQYKFDLFHMFIEKGLRLLNPRGLFGFIIPNPWLTIKYSSDLRRRILLSYSLIELVIFQYHVFAQATVNAMLLFIANKKSAINNYVIVKNVDHARTADEINAYKSYNILQSEWEREGSYIIETRFCDEGGLLAKRIIDSSTKLENVMEVSIGCQAYNRNKHTLEEIKNRIYHSDIKLGEEYLPELAGSDVGRYLIVRKRGKWIKYGPWLHDYRGMEWLKGPRILVREITGRSPYVIQACYAEEEFCNYKTILNIINKKQTKCSLKTVLAVLNSKLGSFIYYYISNKMTAKDFPRITVADLRIFPIFRNVHDSDAKTRMCEKIDKIVGKIMETRFAIAEGGADGRDGGLKKKCDIWNSEIDRLVYELYEIDVGEIAIIEEKLKRT